MVQVYVNPYVALLNARYYLQANADTVDSSEVHIRHGVYRPELHTKASQDDELQASPKNVFKRPDDEVLHITRPVQTAMVGGGCITVDGRGLNETF